MTTLSPETIIPSGIKPSDFWHTDANDNTCSRCRKPVPEAEVPLMLWRDGGDAVLIYCERCLRKEGPS